MGCCEERRYDDHACYTTDMSTHPSQTALPPGESTPIVHLMCGLPGSGKTTFAQRLAITRPALHFSLDVWMLGLYDYTIEQPEYGLCVERCQALIWQTGLQILALGHDVILDWSLWSKARRRTWRERIDGAGYQHRLYYFNIPLTQLQERLRVRNAERPPGTHVITEAELQRFAPYFEVPTPDEGLQIIEVAG